MEHRVVPQCRVKYRAARADEHEAIVRIARKSSYTKDFSNQVMFSSEASYSRGWIVVVTVDEIIAGFACFREKVRNPEVVLYFVGVAEECRRHGFAWGMICAFMRASKHDDLVLKVDRHNLAAQALYLKHGFVDYDSDETYRMMRKKFVRRYRFSVDARNEQMGWNKAKPR